jgi:manganese transport protein
MKGQLVTGASLPEVHASVATARPNVLRRMLAFAGPAYLVSVGYMDPGNWATDLQGGSQFGYQLLWVVVLSNLMAILLQTLAARLGIVAGRDLAQACREAYPRSVCNALWVLCEIAIAACDLAEVLGAAIALHLLFGLPLVIGVLLTAADTLMVLWLARYGIRLIEAMILSLIAIVTGCFLVELFFAKPALHEIFSGIVPRLNDQSLYVAVGILGATVMPHNLYLHSGVVQTRRFGDSVEDRREAIKLATIDSTIALMFALTINAAILILAAATFYKAGKTNVAELDQAHAFLAPLLGSAIAPTLFGIALLCCGLNSTVTATLSGQIVMEGFIDIRLPAWARRLITRAIAITPAAIVTIWYGEAGTAKLLILSQVVLGVALPFSIIPLVMFTADRRKMGALAAPIWVTLLATLTAALLIALNFKLLADQLFG